MTYLRKAWVPPTCPACGEPTAPYQSKTRLWSGSHPWHRRTHLSCLLRLHYGDINPDDLAPPFYRTLTAEKQSWSGGIFVIPFKSNKQ